MGRFEPHAHSYGSNIRLIDCINSPQALVNRAYDMGLSGIALTDHEFLGMIPKFFKAAEALKAKHPDSNFKVAAGNEIYLCDRSNHNKFYHFILIAKNKDGWKALRELSSESWMQSFPYKGLQRVVTSYRDLYNIMQKYPHSLIATTACIGGELSYNTLRLIKAEHNNDMLEVKEARRAIVMFITYCKNVFGEDFYIECAPGCSKEQIAVNQRLVSIAQCFDVKMVVGTDAHYLSKDMRLIHKSYLNSKDGEREIDAFYEYSYLQEEEQIYWHLSKSNFDKLLIEKMFANSNEICNKIEEYSIWHKQTIPQVDVKDYPKTTTLHHYQDKYPTLYEMTQSDNKIERYWINECLQKLKQIGKDNDVYMARLEEEAVTKRIISNKLETNIFAYPVTLQHYVDLFWECGSMVGAGRGSSCSGLNHYLLGVTQLDPIEWNFPWFRYLNESRVELPDIDIDLCPSKRGIILQKIKEERGKSFKSEISNIARKNLGCVLVATFGTEGTKSAILTACRGYRGVDGNESIDVDDAQYMASLIPQERGFVWSLHDVLEGDPSKDRKPVTTFIDSCNRYPGLLDIIKGIEGIVKQRGSHASGVVMNDEDPYEFLAYMKTPSGQVITQFDLHDCEAMGSTKYDFLVTEVQDKLTETLQMLKKDKVIENLSLRELYQKYLHPSILPIDDKKTWDVIQKASSLDLFQLDSDIGRQGAKKVKPRNMLQLSAVNGLIRLMTAEKGAETPMEKYIRFKNDPKQWEKEMNDYHLTQQEKDAIKRYTATTYGIGISQEQLMRALMDKDICDFTLAESNAARKTVAKKQMNKIAELKEKVFEKGASPNIAQYVWDSVVAPSLGYSFSDIHSTAYSFIGFQTAYVTTKWNPIYWNTACLIVNSGSLQDASEEEIVSIYEQEAEAIAEGTTFIDLPDRSGKIKKTSSTDYAKVAKAIGNITSAGIAVSCVDINKSSFGFKPDTENNEILFGLNGLNRIGEPVIKQIVEGRPYLGIKDFMKRCKLNKMAMISLIKAGAFDKLDNEWASRCCKEPRKAILAYYLMQTCDMKTKVNIANFNGMIQRGIVPESLDLYKQIYNFNKYINKTCKNDIITLDDRALEFYTYYFDSDYSTVSSNNGIFTINKKDWSNLYQWRMQEVKDWIINNQQQLVKEFNKASFMELWHKYAEGTVSAWEMESLCFYYHEHELANINTYKYGIVDFNALPTVPAIEKTFRRNGRDIPIFEIYQIAGTVLSKNDTRSSVSMLTTTGVVNVKFTKQQYARFNRQLSDMQEDGKKVVKEKGWFTRGTMLLVSGFRRDDTFQVKTYKSTAMHQVYKITGVINNDISLQHVRWGEADDD